MDWIGEDLANEFMIGLEIEEQDLFSITLYPKISKMEIYYSSVFEKHIEACEDFTLPFDIKLDIKKYHALTY